MGRTHRGRRRSWRPWGSLARGRSFRTDGPRSLDPAWGAGAPGARPQRRSDGRATHAGGGGRAPAGGRSAWMAARSRPRDYHGRLEVVVYSTDRLRVVRGSMRERRAVPGPRGERPLAGLPPRPLRDFERVRAAAQRRARVSGARDLEAWTERFVELGAALRTRRAAYVERLRARARGWVPPAPARRYDVRPAAARPGERRRHSARRCASELVSAGATSARRAAAWSGPHRDHVALTDRRAGRGRRRPRPARRAACSWPFPWLRSSVFREETGQAAVALLDDLDSELDEERAGALCARGRAARPGPVTTAHPAWAERLRALGRIYRRSRRAQVRCA